MFLLSSVFLAFFHFASADQVVYLQTLEKIHFQTCNYNETSVFVSASKESPSLLGKIFITDALGVTKTALELKNRRIYQNRDLKNGWFTKGPLSMYTSLDHTSVSDMTGLVYCREHLATKTNIVTVYDITQPNFIHLQEITTLNQTVVIMNTLSSRTTTVYDWKQKSSHVASVGLGEPRDYEMPGVEIFTNPLFIKDITSSYFVDNVEPFSINEDMFYANFYGGVQFAVRPGAVDMRNYVTAKSSTTGLITKTKYDTNVDKKVTFSKNPNGATAGVSGYNAFGSTINDKLTFDLISNGVHHSDIINYYDEFNLRSYKQLSDTFQVTTKNSFYYYVQYYNIEDPKLAQLSPKFARK